MTFDPEFTVYRNQQVSAEELQRLESLLEQNPDDIQIVDWVAFAHYCTGNHERAVALYQLCIDREPQTPSYYYFMGNCLYKLGRPTDALAQWQMAVSLDVTGLFRKKAEDKIAMARNA